MRKLNNLVLLSVNYIL